MAKKNKKENGCCHIVYHYISDYAIPTKEDVYRMAQEKFGHIDGERGATLEIAYWLGMTDMLELLTQSKNE